MTLKGPDSHGPTSENTESVRATGQKTVCFPGTQDFVRTSGVAATPGREAATARGQSSGAPPAGCGRSREDEHGDVSLELGAGSQASLYPLRADRPYSPQILPDEREPIPRPHGALQRMGEVEHRVIDQHFDMLGQIARRRDPRGPCVVGETARSGGAGPCGPCPRL